MWRVSVSTPRPGGRARGLCRRSTGVFGSCLRLCAPPSRPLESEHESRIRKKSSLFGPSSAPSRSKNGGFGPGRIRLSQLPDYSAASLHTFLAANLAPVPPPRPMVGPDIPVPPASPTIAMSLARWLPTSSCPGFTESSPTSRSGPWASIGGCAANTSNPILMNSSSAFPLQPPAHPPCRIPIPPRHRRRAAAPSLQDFDLTKAAIYGLECNARDRSFARSSGQNLTLDTHV
jgi:hypothetical protein